MPTAKENQAKGELPGSFYQRNERWWWKVRLPGEITFTPRPLIPSGQKFATKDWNTALEVAREIWDSAAIRCSLPADADKTVLGLVKRYEAHAGEYYLDIETRQPTKEVDNISRSLAHLLESFPHPTEPAKTINYSQYPAADFNVVALEQVRNNLIRKDLCRNVINQRINTIRRAFKWAASKLFIPASTYHSLTTLDGLKANRTTARETEEVKPVPESVVQATMEHMTPTLRSMVEIQLLTGMRPGELVIMRPMDLNVTGKVWTYVPGSHLKHGRHKNAWRGHDREVPLGPRCQKILKPMLAGLRLDQFIFSPAKAMAEFRAERSAARTTPLSCGNRPGAHVKVNPRKVPGPKYTSGGYGHAVAYAIKRANAAILARLRAEMPNAGKKELAKAFEEAAVPKWHPHQIRHTAATIIRKRASLDAARAMLGQKSLSMADHYADIDKETCIEAARKLG